MSSKNNSELAFYRELRELKTYKYYISMYLIRKKRTGTGTDFFFFLVLILGFKQKLAAGKTKVRPGAAKMKDTPANVCKTQNNFCKIFYFLCLRIGMNIDEHFSPSILRLLELVHRKRVQKLVQQEQGKVARHIAQTAVPVDCRPKLRKQKL